MNKDLFDIMNKTSFNYTCLVKNKLTGCNRLLIATCKLSDLKKILSDNLKSFEVVENIKDDNNYLLSSIFYK
jgi:hypothetical protein